MKNIFKTCKVLTLQVYTKVISYKIATFQNTCVQICDRNAFFSQFIFERTFLLKFCTHVKEKQIEFVDCCLDLKKTTFDKVFFRNGIFLCLPSKIVEACVFAGEFSRSNLCSSTDTCFRRASSRPARDQLSHSEARVLEKQSRANVCSLPTSFLRARSMQTPKLWFVISNGRAAETISLRSFRIFNINNDEAVYPVYENTIAEINSPRMHEDIEG